MKVSKYQRELSQSYVTGKQAAEPRSGPRSVRLHALCMLLLLDFALVQALISGHYFIVHSVVARASPVIIHFLLPPIHA